MTEESVAITVVCPPPTVEERARTAAKEGNIEALYGLIREKADFLKNIEMMEFVDTPLHIAAAAGHTEFAMELMNLKPSFVTKLNQDGLSPIHLALHNEHPETVLSRLRFDKNIARIKGKKGYTPLHYVVMKGGDVSVLTKFLKDCPECIHDLTNRDETALHLAARDNNEEALRVLIFWLRSSDRNMLQIKTIMNFKNKDGDTVLHIAASNNQPKIVRLLTQHGVNNLNATNTNNLTALGILQGRNQNENEECVNILRSSQRRTVITTFIGARLIELISRLAYETRHMSSDRSNALLVATVLILTATYQAALSPPGGVFQANSQPPDNTTSTTTSLQIHSSSNNTSTLTLPHLFNRNPFTAGASVLSTLDFLWFFIPNIGAFCISFLVTCFALISILPGFLSFPLVLSLLMLLFCLLMSAVLIISPNSQSLTIMFQYVYILAYILFFFIYLVIAVVIIRRIRKRGFRKQYMKNKQ